MKKAQEILGLPIISISDGMEAGKVKGIIVNSEKGTIDYIIVDKGIQIFGASVIPAGAVLGIGEYALTIESENIIKDINKVPEAIDLLQKEIRVTGTGVMTRKGMLIGETGDIYIDEDNNCSISGIEFFGDITQKKMKIIPRDKVITFGKKLTVVKEDVENSLLDTPSELNSGNRDMAVGAGSIYKAEDTDYAVGTGSLISQPEEKQDIKAAEYVEDDSIKEESEGSTSILFEQKQRQYLIGRKASKTIVDNSKNIIIKEDDIIDDKTVDDAKAKGKLVELVMNNRA